ncbi:TetR/AcrR family transcriptional regulator [Leifsonia kafniensis]|uniref:TetR/AcrR family transcriptional regulator n=1 Tax=Leifsonia kafniensis TaxID=475957 RepID=A0ABP7KTA2_9MICO
MATKRDQTERGTSSTASRGRPRDPGVDLLIHRAALELLGEVGYDHTSIEGVAARSGVAKASIYRRWPGKPELILDAVRAQETVVKALPEDTGTLRGDLLAAIPSFLVFSSFESSQAPIIVGLIQAMRKNPDLVAYMRGRFISSINHSSEIIVERAIARGEVPAAARDIRLFHDIAPSLAMARMLLTYDPIDEQFEVELVDTILIPLLKSA